MVRGGGGNYMIFQLRKTPNKIEGGEGCMQLLNCIGHNIWLLIRYVLSIICT